MYDKSTAALKIAKGLRFPYNLFSIVIIIVPKFLRDAVYRQVSQRRFNRYARMCMLPNEEERKYFLEY